MTSIAPSRPASTTRTRSAAAEKALERRRKRLAREAAAKPQADPAADTDGDAELADEVGGSDTGGRRLRRSTRSLGTTGSLGTARDMLTSRPRVSFVVVVIGLFVIGVALTLVLTTRSAQGSYQNADLQTAHDLKQDQLDNLKRQYEAGNAAPELAKKAAENGMVAVTNPQHISGTGAHPRVTGEQTPVTGTPVPDALRDTKPKNEPRPTSVARRPASAPVEPEPAPAAQPGQTNVLPTGAAPSTNPGPAR